MADSPIAPREFTAELRRCRLRHASDFASALSGRTQIPADAASADGVGLPSPPFNTQPAIFGLDFAQPTAESCDFLALENEISQLKEAVEQMKREIAALRADKSPAPSLQKAAGELDAVVQATENATHNILEAAERIDETLTDLRSKTDAVLDPAALELLGDQVVRIFESCNFQDIAGQRINKVVNTMKFIEVRIDRMIEILGGSEALQDVELPVVEEVDEEASLLEGPQLDGAAKISQTDIDRFFD